MTRYRILGPLEVWDGDERLALGGPQQRALLALLLVEANRVVAADRLIEHLWGDAHPRTARSLLQGCVAQLRRALLSTGADRQPLLTRAPGYLIQVEDGELDLDRFTELDRLASGIVAGNRPGLARAADLWTEALGLWRGPAMDDVTLDACRIEAARLDELRMAVLEKRIDADLRLRRAPDLVGELNALVLAHPLREHLWAQLMAALVETGQRAEALACYRRLRTALVDELGVEPGTAVRDLHQVILTGGDALAAHLDGAVPAVPEPQVATARTALAELPRMTPGFAGRTDYLRRLDDLLTSVDDQAVVAVIAGMGGVGKTAVAVQWAHRHRHAFTDGQLFVNLRGHAAGSPVRPIEALHGFLRTLGVPASQVPDDLARASAQYRSLLDGKRILVVLDDARDAEQVRPLLPAGAGCLVLVTSRDSLAGLVARDGARPITLDVLDDDEAHEVLATVLGAARVGAEPDAAAELVQLCARLPLAIRIVAAHLLMHEHRRLADEVAELSARDRLTALQVAGDEDTAVRVAFERSYAALGADARLLFRLLGLVPLPDFTAETVGALVGTGAASAGRLLEELAGVHLLLRPAPGRFAFHDLIRLYAAERAQAEVPAPDRAAASGRLLLAYLVTADAADRVLSPDRLRLPMPAGVPEPLLLPADHGQALEWLDAERANLVVAVRYAAEHGPGSVAWSLASTLKGYFQLRMLTLDWRTVATLGLAAAESGGDVRARVTAHLNLGGLHERLGEYGVAGVQCARALALARRAGWLEAEGVALAELGILCRHAGRLGTAAEHFAAALDLARRTGWHPLVAGRLISLGNIHAEAGELGRAADCYAEALPITRQIGSRTGEAIVLANLGECCLILGRIGEAVEHFGTASTLNRETGHRGLAADNLRALAAAHVEAGHGSAALELAEAALSENRATGDRRYEAAALNTLGTVHLLLDEPDRAAEHHRQALDLSREIGVRRHEVSALVGLAHCLLRLGRADEARGHADNAVTLARHDSFRLLEGPALTAAAGACLAQGGSSAAADRAAQALAVERETGYRLGAARALLVLSDTADPATASSLRQEAFDLFAAAGVPPG